MGCRAVTARERTCADFKRSLAVAARYQSSRAVSDPTPYRLLEEDAAKDRVRRRIRIDDAHDYVPAEIPHQVLTTRKGTDRPAVQQVVIGIQYVNALGA